MTDKITTWLTPHAHFRWVTASAAATCRAITQQQATNHSAGKVFSERIIGTLLAQTVLFKSSGQLTMSWLTATGDPQTVADVTTDGNVRAYTTSRECETSVAEAPVLKIAKMPKQGKRSDSHIALATASCAAQFVDYFSQSEQVTTWCHLDATSGWLLQALPGVSASVRDGVTAWYQRLFKAHPEWQLCDWQQALATHLAGDCQQVTTTSVAPAQLWTWADYQQRLTELPLVERERFFDDQAVIHIYDPYAHRDYTFTAQDCGISASTSDA